MKSYSYKTSYHSTIFADSIFIYFIKMIKKEFKLGFRFKRAETYKYLLINLTLSNPNKQLYS
ncbi:hypothetical protein HCMG_00391 [Helicobacter canadensis MIT 98-5491]|nr:hypothetical protein HCMG_00391 [Helicobacter canadensis MIT 98-5491]